MKFWILKGSEKDKTHVEEEVVECSDCNHLIRKGIASSVEYHDRRWDGWNIDPMLLWYCPEHKKPYGMVIHERHRVQVDKMHHRTDEVKRFYIKADWVETDEKGKQIKLLEHGERN